MDKKLYSIGEISKMMGITVQTLRHYDSINLLRPKYVNPQTGYRFYSSDQLHLIDRIKYLQTFGLSLDEINRILKNNDIPLLIQCLLEKRNEVRNEIERIQEKCDDIQWYIDYFDYVKQDLFSEVPYKLQLPKRYLLAVSCRNQDKVTFHLRLEELKCSQDNRMLKYRRQFSYILDFEKLMQKELAPLSLGMFIKTPPDFESEYIIEIPAGEYLCFKGKILTDEWNPELVSKLFSEKQKESLKPMLVLANEFENSLKEYTQCMYEIQILVKKED